MIPLRHARSHAPAADVDGPGAATAVRSLSALSRIAAEHNKPAIARAPDRILLFMSSPSGTIDPRRNLYQKAPTAATSLCGWITEGTLLSKLAKSANQLFPWYCFDTATSLLVMNSSSAGTPFFVCSIPR